MEPNWLAAMKGGGMNIGKLEPVPNLSSEYLKLAFEDEEAAQYLSANGKHRHAVYFYLQAMEKYVRAKIFHLVNPEPEYFRNRVRTHNLDELLGFLIEICSSKENIRSQVKNQLEEYVLGGIKFGMLHNDLRYPFYIEKNHSYFLRLVGKEQSELMREKVRKLKAFLQDLERLSR
jgi:HEPN domain-containing protein